MSAALARRRIEALYREESRRIYASLIRLLGDMQLAEEALQEAFRAALEQWPESGIPDNPRAWLVSAGRFKAIDALRRQSRHRDKLDQIGDALMAEAPDPADLADNALEDDRLRLIFTCCHPALAEPARVALTLREVCDLSTEAIASAFLVPVPTLAQRIVRAKAKIRDAAIAFEVPAGAALEERLQTVLQVIYLLYNEGYSSSRGAELGAPELVREAVRLAELLLELLPHAETRGLLALMLLQESRRATRTDAAGDLVLLADQDRERWDRELIARGEALVTAALRAGGHGPYALQAAIAAVHAGAPSFDATDWREIVGLYDLLLALSPSPVIELNRAVAVGMRDGPAAGEALVAELAAEGALDRYHLLHAARADFLRQLGRSGEALAAYRRALELAQQAPEQRFLAGRIAALEGAAPENRHRPVE
ncbi:sigma-70 family RNA polymerase sigma factor [Parahaliea mediterranea]|uniref:Sigma-70 family RNA polymerase sigma factor n=1 Tax=Parahaliea mediterranea TaxID=651086 RepID=A0A939DIM3_9GAMM|nr:sigma-70 family RNA polymerase sigma factor [Parahaliea mediterranea]